MVSRWVTLAAALGAVAALVTPVLPAATAAVQQTGIVSDNPANWTPNVLDGSVKAIVQVGNTMIVGGVFTQVQGAAATDPVLSRSNIFAFDATTGVISDTFAPPVDAEVSAIVVSADEKSVYIGGPFNTVNGVTTRKIAKLLVATGQKVAGFNPGAISSKINDMALSRGRLIIGGQFNTIKAVSRPILASLDPTTGALTSAINVSFTGKHNGGTTSIVKFAVDPAGNRLVAIGNFTTVGGLDRHQVAMLDISGATATVADWRTTLYTSICASVFDTYLRDLDISPDGSYVVISTTGAYHGQDSGCDVISRFEMGATGANVLPTWRDYTGGDTTYAVAITGAAVYVGGHFRWMNNAFAADTAGPGAVPREGIAALDPENGLPFSWDPSRAPDRGVGVFDLLATPAGLWVGDDTERLNNELRKRIAFLPLAGGAVVPPKATGSLPGETYLLGGFDPSVLYRVNAGGPELGATDDGPNWLADSTASPSPLHTTGGVATTYATNVSVDSTVPSAAGDKAPVAIFNGVRSDPTGGNDMQWSIPATAGLPLTVRLYFANRSTARTFNVAIDGVSKLASYSPPSTGTMRAFDVTSDGTVNINFTRGSGDPLISGIEVINRNAVAGGSAAAGQVRHQTYTGSGAPAATTTDPGTELWGQARGAFLVDQTLYTGFAGGTFSARTFDGRNVGAPTSINLYGGTFAADLPNITGMVYDGGRIYFTLANDPNLYYRYFSTQAAIVGSVRFVATGDLTAMAPQRVAGMFLSGSTLYLADKTDGHLYKVTFTHGVVAGPAALADATIDWRSRGAFMLSGPVPPATNVPPVASLAGTLGQPCAANVCTLDGSASTDSDGTIASYAWSFGDGGTGSGSTASHAYAAAGAYVVTLTVTDDRGGSNTATQTVNAGDPPNQQPVAAFTTDCTNLTCTVNGSGSSDADGSVTSLAWSFGDGHTDTGTSATYTYPAPGGTFNVSLVVTDNDGASSDPVVHQVTVAPAPISPVAFRAAATASTNKITNKVSVPATVQAGDALLLFVTTNSLNTVTAAPTGWTAAGTQAVSDVRTLLYTKVATATDAGQAASITFPTATKTDLTLLAYSGAATVPFEAIASAGETVNRSSHTTPGVTVPTAGSWVVSYWADKSSATTSWSDPPSQLRRSTSVGTGAGHVTSLATDLGAASVAGPAPGLTATADSASAKATMWSVVIKAAS